MITVNIHEAKTRLSELIHAVERGETVQICRRNEPVAQVTIIEKKPKKERPIGLHDGEFEIPDSAFEPMSAEELALWDGPLCSNDISDKP